MTKKYTNTLEIIYYKIKGNTMYVIYMYLKSFFCFSSGQFKLRLNWTKYSSIVGCRGKI